MSHLLPVILQNLHTGASFPAGGSLSLDAARTMCDYAAHLGAGLPKYLLAPKISLLLSYIDDLTGRMYFEKLWNTGARLNEALALTPACFTLEPTRRHPQTVVMLTPCILIRTTGNRLSREFG